ncbi:DUF1516 family protein [Aneurinibacillus migulanus]|uniref:Uncharacterized protein n=1 Tax=Aneurinibacillus migulanus TaxID=47500 RepID=A0A0M0H1N2_ANEMI|nr:DUF1516 family protein [Aneurinibacillus migulanus]KON96065.1 hypothetical protein AF333_11765 [Aneurinibacillus migulanus]MCP1356645.1 YisL family protein [Aneurinibacillus migulanus]MED0894998.1 DUF1516 family protein [Aneurinibacillus migulanus]MED1614788.1 DUF1516 family protein [Aneurinibacillus migulanus]MED4727284.1 DUF1516 family protein [Aneurinibacillus migulanus]
MSSVDLHSSFWVIALILFFISYILLRRRNMRGQLVTHMILRLVYLFVLFTGIRLVMQLNAMPITLVKGFLALILIALMESILVRGKKGMHIPLLWILFFIDIAAVFYIGYAVIG